MKRVLAAAWVLMLATAVVQGQQYPKPTPAGIKGLDELIRSCLKAGGLKAVKDPKGGDPYLAVADPARLRAAVADKRNLLTPAVFDALVASWQIVDEREEPFTIALLQAAGDAAGDDLALAFVAAFKGGTEERAGHAAAAVRDYEDAERLFHACQNRDWGAAMLNSAGVLYAQQGELKKALADHKQALKLWRETYGPKHPAVATSLNNIGAVYYRQGKYREALRCHQQALDIRRQTYKSPNWFLARSLDNLGIAYHQLGEYERALAAYQEALDNVPSDGAEDRALRAETLGDIGGVHEYQGDYAKALDYQEKALALWLKTMGTRQHPGVADALHNIGSLYARQGEYGRALEYYQQALGIRQAVYHGDHPDVALSLNAIGMVFLYTHELDQALSYHGKALAMRQQWYHEPHPDVARSLNNVAGVYDKQGDEDHALGHYREAIAVWEKVYPDGRSFELAASLDNLGGVYHRLGDDQQALAQARRARAILEEVFGDRHPELALTLANEAYYQAAAGENAEALESLDRAVAALRTRPDKAPAAPATLSRADLMPLPLTVGVLDQRGWLLERTAAGRDGTTRLRASAQSYALAVAVLERVRREVIETEANKLQAGEERFELFPRLVGVHQRLFKSTGRTEDLEAAFTAAEAGTARLFVESLARSRAENLGGVSAELRAEESRLLRLLGECDARLRREQDRPAGEHDPKQLGRLLDERQDNEDRLRKLVARLAQDYPQYAALKYPKPPSLAEGRSCLNPGEVALVFVLGRDASFVEVVGGPAAPDLGLTIYRLPPAADIAETVSVLTDQETLLSSTKVRALAPEAYRQLLGPVAERIKGKDLVIVPSGRLSLLPFELLIEEVDAQGKEHYLVERHRIRYAPSLQVLSLLRQRQRSQEPDRLLWALGDPVYDTADDRVPAGTRLAASSAATLAEYRRRAASGPGGRPVLLPRLRSSAGEVAAIRRVLGAGPDAVRTGLEASEASVKEASDRGGLGRARYVHFNAHGILGLDAGLQPSLVLSLVGDGKEDGFLQMDEVTRLTLNADLVLLSACDSGQGRLYSSEGVVGLARAFLHAGSRGVLCSLWPVEDEHTAAFMEDFYRKLQAGDRPADALQAVQRARIEAGQVPLHWAPFVLIGE